MIVFQSLTRKKLETLLLPLGGPRPEVRARVRAQQLFQWVYQRHVTDWDQMTDLAKELRVWLKENVEILRLKERQSHQSLDGTHKFLWDLGDSKTVESVVIPAALDSKKNFPKSGFAGLPQDERMDSERWKRLTACISSQVGCAMACKFCLTGVQGFDRHLKIQEIVAQIHELRRLAPITNIVFMGMGEPLHNIDAVIDACEILIDQFGLGFSRRKITVSTSGLVPAIYRLAKESPVCLAVSLNATTDEQRESIMPVNRSYPIHELLKACDYYSENHTKYVTFEYVLLRGINDSLEDAHRLVKLLRHRSCKVNLIPFNEHPGSEFKRPEDLQVRSFQRILLTSGMTATVRISRGRDILAACGQLRSLFGTARGSTRHRDWKDAIAPTAASLTSQTVEGSGSTISG